MLLDLSDLSGIASDSEDSDSDGGTSGEDNEASVLHKGIMKKDTHLARAVINRLKREGRLEAVINHQNNAGQSPLLLACIINKPQIAKILLEHGANPNQDSFKIKQDGTKSFNAPLHFVAEKGQFYIEMLAVLLEHGLTEVNRASGQMETPLHCAIRCHGLHYKEEHGRKQSGVRDCRRTIKMLVDRGAEFRAGPNDQTPLHYVGNLPFRDNETDFLNFFQHVLGLVTRDRRKDLLERNSDKGTVLHVIAAKQFKNQQGKQAIMDTLRYLIHEVGVDPTLKDMSDFKAKRHVHNQDNDIKEYLTKEIKNFKRHENKIRHQREIRAQQGNSACMMNGSVDVLPGFLENIPPQPELLPETFSHFQQHSPPQHNNGAMIQAMGCAPVIQGNVVHNSAASQQYPIQQNQYADTTTQQRSSPIFATMPQHAPTIPQHQVVATTASQNLVCSGGGNVSVQQIRCFPANGAVNGQQTIQQQIPVTLNQSQQCFNASGVSNTTTVNIPQMVVPPLNGMRYTPPPNVNVNNNNFYGLDIDTTQQPLIVNPTLTIL